MFQMGKLPSCSFAQVFWNLQPNANFFKLKLREKIVRSPGKMILFRGKKQLEGSSAQLVCTCLNTVESLLPKPQKFSITVQQKP